MAKLSPLHQEVVRLHMSGFKRQEIADKIGRCIASVERYLALIRKTWRMELEGEHDGTQDT